MLPASRAIDENFTIIFPIRKRSDRSWQFIKNGICSWIRDAVRISHSLVDKEEAAHATDRCQALITSSQHPNAHIYPLSHGFAITT